MRSNGGRVCNWRLDKTVRREFKRERDMSRRFTGPVGNEKLMFPEMELRIQIDLPHHIERFGMRQRRVLFFAADDRGGGSEGVVRGHGGRGGIRTHGRFNPTLDFESSAFNRTQPPFLVYVRDFSGEIPGEIVSIQGMGDFCKNYPHAGQRLDVCATETLEESFQAAEDVCFSGDADGLISLFSVFEEDQGGNALDAKLQSCGRAIVHIDFGDDKFPGILRGDFFNDRCEPLAGSAPRGPKIQEHRRRGAIKEGLEVGILQFSDMRAGHKQRETVQEIN